MQGNGQLHETSCQLSAVSNQLKTKGENHTTVRQAVSDQRSAISSKTRVKTTLQGFCTDAISVRGLAIGWEFGFRTRSHSRGLPEQGALFRFAPIYVILLCWQAIVSGASCEVTRAMHKAGPVPSGDFWFLLAASKGTRRRHDLEWKGKKGSVIYKSVFFINP